MKFARYDAGELLGYTPLTGVTDAEIWQHLITAQVKALLGRIVRYGEPQVMETIKGLFPGDEATNLNLHRLYAGSCECVRFPYLSTMHKTEYGALVIKRDGVKVKAMCWVGDVMNGKGELVYMAALRDRRFDGTRRANDSALLFYTYDDPRFHSVLDPRLKSAEVSIYTYLPGSRILDATGDTRLDAFFERPFAFITNPQEFLVLFEKAWRSNRAPGQFAAPIPDVSKLVLPGFERLARKHGYDLLESAVSHYHVAWWFKSRGYGYNHAADAATMQKLADGIKRIKESGKPLTRQQESWVCVVQSLRSVELIPEGLYLDGTLWPQDNIGPQLLWMNKPLTETARRVLDERARSQSAPAS